MKPAFQAIQPVRKTENSRHQRDTSIDQQRMAEMKQHLEQQEIKRRMGVGVNVIPEAAPVILLRYGNMPVTVVFDVLKRPVTSAGQPRRARSRQERGSTCRARSMAKASISGSRSNTVYTAV